MGQVVSIKSFTQKKKTTYIENNGKTCPSCNSTSIDDSAVVEFDGDRAWHARTCESCKDEWIEYFRLGGVGEYNVAIPISKGRAYLEGGGAKCLFCESDEIAGDDFDPMENGMAQKTTCDECGKSWYDLYALVDIE